MPRYPLFISSSSKTTGNSAAAAATPTPNNSKIVVWDGIEWTPSKNKCTNCKPDKCYVAVSGGHPCLRCRKNHKGCIRRITTSSKKISKASSKTSEKQDPKPKSATRQVQKMEAIVNRDSQPPGRTEAAKTATEEPKEDKLDLSSIMKDVEANFKKSIAKIQMMTEGLEEAEKLQKMNVEGTAICKLGTKLDSLPYVFLQPFFVTASLKFPVVESSSMKGMSGKVEDKPRSTGRESSNPFATDVLLTLREVIDEALTRRGQEPSRKRVAKGNSDIIDLI
ncbi:hypothetical protein AGABI1DRAFT_132181 [Agaricus bisporus var. burnettii JB137-S8]|uniref:Uncharacterized protein n=1 Tax=Agaricus bisporus var. burnettii (strain JB137-S8 / ATCC MYA-4627 / FGSC 10392) TaxID=597362 RepID=K5WXG9_AGABU|nr:uncharacterized protein AGABI1DRAFT_132181 [Agaricus bisporus var. burnettii JB137-S8]EKM75513.1 hypothetical protein AGABI1DRAFT_132181 [Agaricus bisporus var. burnettii JB137-S8]